MNVPLGGREPIAANVYACRDAIPNTGIVTDHLNANANPDGVGCIATNVSDFLVKITFQKRESKNSQLLSFFNL